MQFFEADSEQPCSVFPDQLHDMHRTPCLRTAKGAFRVVLPSKIITRKSHAAPIITNKHITIIKPNSSFQIKATPHRAGGADSQPDFIGISCDFSTV